MGKLVTEKHRLPINMWEFFFFIWRAAILLNPMWAEVEAQDVSQGRRYAMFHSNAMPAQAAAHISRAMCGLHLEMEATRLSAYYWPLHSGMGREKRQQETWHSFKPTSSHLHIKEQKPHNALKSNNSSSQRAWPELHRCDTWLPLSLFILTAAWCWQESRRGIKYNQTGRLN